MNTKNTSSGVSIALNKAFTSSQDDSPLSNKPAQREFTIKVANTLEERQAAFRLGYQVYLSKGYINSNYSEMLICNYDIDPETLILIVQDTEKNVVGSVTLVFDETIKLPAEKVYRSEVKSLKTNGEKLVELCRLVISPDYRNAKEILVLLFNYLAIYSYFVKQYDGLVVEVVPNHKNYYKRLLMFDEIGTEKPCPQVQSTIGVLLHLPLERYHAEAVRCANFQEQNIKDRTLYPYFISKPEQVNLVVYYLKKQKSPMTEKEKIYFGLAGSSLSLTAVV